MSSNRDMKSGNGQTKDAFSELMTASKRRKSNKEAPSQSEKTKTKPAHTGGGLNKGFGKDALFPYIRNPEKFPSNVVLYHNENWVALNDAFPKGSVHTLLLPRNVERSQQHPLEALQDPEFLADARAEIEILKKIAASELRRKFGKHSAKEKARMDAMELDPPPEELPPGRDWEDELEVGIHAGPSMNHLHIHVLSREYMGSHGKTARHYCTFKTPFFVRLQEFPLSKDDERFVSLKQFTQADPICWRCGKAFTRTWAPLEAHLEEEFKNWKSE